MTCTDTYRQSLEIIESEIKGRIEEVPDFQSLNKLPFLVHQQLRTGIPYQSSACDNPAKLIEAHHCDEHQGEVIYV